MSWWEIFGFLVGVATIWLFTVQSVWSWPAAIAYNACWFALYSESGRTLDARLSLVHIGLAVLGWYVWVRAGRTDDVLWVGRTPGRETRLLMAATALGGALLWWQGAAVTSAASLVVLYLLIRGRVEAWWWWIALGLVSTVVLARQGYYLTAVVQPFLIALCLGGRREWRRHLMESDQLRRGGRQGSSTGVRAA